jgi:hypothetical protein
VGVLVKRRKIKLKSEIKFWPFCVSDKTMLRPSALKSLLGQANSGGVHSTFLLNREGSLVAYAGLEDTEARVDGAIAASIW